MRKIKKEMNKKLNSAIKEIESKAIDFFNIPKEIVNDPSLDLGQKIVVTIAIDEIGGIFESGGKPSYDEALENRIGEIIFEKMAKFEKEIISNSPFPH